MERPEKKGTGAMGQLGLLLVSLGAGQRRGWEDDFGTLQNRMQQAFPGWQVEGACAGLAAHQSGFQRQVPSPAQAMESMAAQGVKKLAIQPLYLLEGREYHRLRQQAAEQARLFMAFCWGEPLFAAPEDHRQGARALAQAIPVDRGEALVLVGHGAGHPAHAAYQRLAQAFRALGYDHVFVGTLQGSPGLEEVLERLRQAGYRRALLAPLMMTAGLHAQRDLAGSQGSWKAGLERAGLKVRCLLQGLGRLETVQRLYVEHARQAVGRLESQRGGTEKSDEQTEGGAA